MSYYNKKLCDFDVLIGKTITEIKGLEQGSEEVDIYTSDGKHYVMYHWQECCEEVEIDDVVGNVEDLLNTPILRAEENSNQDNPKYEYEDSFTWTFYTLATVKGYVDIRWYGSSNGYYSEDVGFYEVLDD